MPDSTPPGSPARRLEALWRKGQRPEVAAFLADLGPISPTELAEVLCVDQRRRWPRGERLPSEHYLQAYPALRSDPECALELIFHEFVLREERGETPTFAEYARRFPEQADRLEAQLRLYRALDDGLGESVDTRRQDDSSASPAHGEGEWPAVSGYEILEELGRGGMGIVFKARQVGLNRLVALKMILGGACATPEQVLRFRREAEAAARLQHPNIVQVHEIGAADGRPYFSLEFVGGGTLAARIAGTPRPVEEAAALVAVLARAVHYAHERGVIHRDLKPANVLLAVASSQLLVASKEIGAPSSLATGNWQLATTPKIADFGLAKLLSADGVGQTESGTLLGTPSYMAPEQAGGPGAKVGPAADVYALGAILYELLTGRPPFKGASAFDTVQQVLGDEPVPPGRLRPHLPRDLQTVCLKCLEKDPGKRYASARELAEELDRFLRREPIRARPVGVPARFGRWCLRNRALAAASGAAAAGLAAALILGAGFGVSQYQAARDLREERDKTQAAFVGQRRLVAWQALDLGLRLGEQGDCGHGLLQMARALRLATADGDDGLERVTRTNLDAWRRSVNALRYVLPHESPVLAADLSPDGRVALAGCADGRVLFWATETERPIGEPLRHDAPVRHAAFSPDGKLLVTVAGNTVRVWNVEGRTLALPFDQPGEITAVVFRPDSRAVLTACASGDVRVRDAASGKEIGPPICHGGAARSAAFSPDGRTVLTCGADFTARLWDAATGKPKGTLPGHTASVTAAAFGPDGRTVVTACRDWKARVWKLNAEGSVAGDPVALAHHGPVMCLAVSRDGASLLTGSADGKARFWDLATGKLRSEPLLHFETVHAVAFGPNGQTALTANPGAGLRLWRLGGIPERRTPFAHPGWVVSAAFSPDRTLLASGGSDGTVRLWDAATGRPRGEPLTHGDTVRSLAFGHDGRTLVSGGEDRRVRFWDVGRGRSLGKDFLNPGKISSVALAPDDRHLLAGTLNGRVTLWDVEAGVARHEVQAHESPVFGLAFSPDGRFFLSGGADHKARLWETPSCRPVGEPFTHREMVQGVAFSPDGRAALSASIDRTARLWDVATGQPLGSPLYGAVPAGAALFSPDGATILVGGRQDSSRLWDRATHKPLGVPETQDGPLLAASFSPAGDEVLVAEEGKSIRLWKVPRPLGGETERILLWVEVITGMELDADGAVHLLGAEAWQERYGRLRDRGGAPAP